MHNALCVSQTQVLCQEFAVWYSFAANTARVVLVTSSNPQRLVVTVAEQHR
jgi:hypothetical protein